MTPSHDGGPLSTLDPAIKDELCGLLARLCDDALVATDRLRLNHILTEHASARRFYLQYIAVHSALAVTAGGPVGCTAADAQLAIERITLERFVGHTTFAPSCDDPGSPAIHESRLRSIVRWSITVAVALCTIAATLWWNWPIVERPVAITKTVETKDSVAPRQSTNVADEVAVPRRLVAEVTYVSDPAVWQNPNASYALGSHVQAGQRLTLGRGQVELTYSSGARLLLIGPSEFLVQPTGGKLRRGELVARVPEAGHGFTIETPHGKVIDLGTEFGVVVDDFGVSQVSVFEGKVETLPTGNTGITRDKIELTSGRAIQWTDNAIIPISTLGRRYHRLSAKPAANQLVPASTAALNEHFRGEPLSPEHWKTLGEVSVTEHGLRLAGAGDPQQRPYLLTAREFDPSYGALTVVCDLRFEDVPAAEQISCAILTRSSDQRSKPGTPWHDMLARSVSCRFAANPQSGEGMLESGTKYEADRELTNISWDGFSRPQANTLYRLEMCDDGLNVTFTVSLVDNPLVRKTITCRSLFRGNRNFIALEGPAAGSMVVERLVISQEATSIDNAVPLATKSDDKPATSGQPPADFAEQLARLSPHNATLLLQDDFGQAQLDLELWTTLGDVVVRDGQVQLGLPNNEQHIDTWRARPYLLTKAPIDPADGGLIIVGKATFADNFLQGYGGSFAVMTRAEAEHGTGTGWESSILRRGIRANFWPAAYGFDHSLEIHEKPGPDAIRLLAAEGFRISPQSRTYLFCIVDDGRSATLTVVDATNPTIQKTVSHETSPQMSSRGRIAFESCWGSPVLLDCIRIFQSNGGQQGRDGRTNRLN
jgi:hypothetical protein